MKKSRALREGTAYLKATRQAERALSAGCRAPNFCLSDQDGTEVSSEVLVRGGPIVLTFYSGTWCSSCMRDLITLERLRPSIEAQGVGVLAISQQTAAENRRARSAASIELPLLRDIGGNVGFQFGIRWTIPEVLPALCKAGGIDLPIVNGEDSWTLPIAARFVIDRNGLIVYSEINPDHTRGSGPRNMLPLVKHLHQRWLATRLDS